MHRRDLQPVHSMPFCGRPASLERSSSLCSRAAARVCYRLLGKSQRRSGTWRGRNSRSTASRKPISRCSPSAASNTSSPMPAPISRRSSRPMPRRRIAGCRRRSRCSRRTRTSAMSMAHGYAVASGKVPAVMVHVSVGTANALCGVFNAARANVPILFTAGRSPLTEEGLPGARDTYIHWAQEMFDQAGMLREMVKWDYELRNGVQLETVVDRALTIGDEPARGSGLSVACRARCWPSRCPGFAYDSPSRRARGLAAGAGRRRRSPRRHGSSPTAQNPLIITADAGRDRAAVAALARFRRALCDPGRRAPPAPSERCRPTTPATSATTRRRCSTMPMRSSSSIATCRGSRAARRPPPDCKIIHIGVDPLYQPLSDPRLSLRCRDHRRGAAGAAAARRGAEAARGRSARSPRGAQRYRRAPRDACRRGWRKAREEAKAMQRRSARSGSAPASPRRATRTRRSSTNTRCCREHCPSTRPGSFFGSSPAAGLGWGAGAALGVKLAEPDRQVIAVLGDGSYIFANPVAVHHAATLHRLPVLFVVVNNAMWGAVRRATLGMYPQGRSRAQQPARPLSTSTNCRRSNRSAPRRAAMASGSRTRPNCPRAFERALHAVDVEKRQALLNVICQGGGGG